MEYETQFLIDPILNDRIEKKLIKKTYKNYSI
jgi:hypothetical protein